MVCKKKLWQEESMKEAVAFVQSGSSLRQAAKLYNVPVETLRRRFNGTVTLDCKPGPSTVLTADEERCLADYVIEMADRGLQSDRDVPILSGTVWLAEDGWRLSEDATPKSLSVLLKQYPIPELLAQPLDISVFKSFKAGYAKAYRKYMMDNPGRVITSEVIASLVGKSWVESVTPVNILSGFKKSGIFPLNPSEVSDRMLTPSVTFNPSTSDSASSSTSPTFTADQVHLYEERFSEGYDLHDPQYELWVKENYPSSSDTDSLKTHVSTKSISTVSSDPSDILKYPEPKVTSKTKKQGMNTCSAVCLSDSPMVRQLKEDKERKRQLEIEKQRKKDEKEEKKAERERCKLLKEKQKEERMKEREAKRKQKEQTSAKKASSRRAKTTRNSVSNEGEGGVSNEEGGSVSNEERDGEDDCPVCHIKGLCCQWICCDSCDTWLHIHCTEVDPKQIPDIYYCFKCV